MQKTPHDPNREDKCFPTILTVANETLRTTIKSSYDNDAKFAPPPLCMRAVTSTAPMPSPPAKKGTCLALLRGPESTKNARAFGESPVNDETGGSNTCKRYTVHVGYTCFCKCGVGRDMFKRLPTLAQNLQKNVLNTKRKPPSLTIDGFYGPCLRVGQMMDRSTRQ